MITGPLKSPFNSRSSSSFESCSNSFFQVTHPQGNNVSTRTEISKTFGLFIEIAIPNWGPGGILGASIKWTSFFQWHLHHLSSDTQNPPNKKPVSMQTTGWVEFLLLRQPGCPSRTRGFPSYDCSRFGFISIYNFLLPLGTQLECQWRKNRITFWLYMSFEIGKTFR